MPILGGLELASCKRGLCAPELLPTPTSTLSRRKLILMFILTIALGVGLGVGLTYNEGHNLSSTMSYTSDVLEDTSLAALTTSDSSRHISFQDSGSCSRDSLCSLSSDVAQSYGVENAGIVVKEWIAELLLKLLVRFK